MKIAILGTRGIPANYGGFETCAEEISVDLVPNPASETISIEINNYLGGEVLVSIYDVHGKFIQRLNFFENASRLNISEQAGGIYFVKIQLNDRITYKKLIVVK